MRFVLLVLTTAFYGWTATVEGNVDPQKLIDWVNSQKKISSNLAVQANGKDKNHGGTGFCLQCSDDNSRPTAQAKTVSLYQTPTSVFFQADMDIDCDGSNDGVCAGTDPSHQNQLSCDDNARCSKDNGGPISAASTPFYVIPEGSPFNYGKRGIAIGQLGAVINTKTKPISIVYGTFLDADGVSQEIGEASAAMAKLLGVPNNPNTGGQSSGITYIIFRGQAGRLNTVSDWANHKKAIAVGQALAAKLIATHASHAATSAAAGIDADAELDQPISDHSVNMKSLRFTMDGEYSFSILSMTGEKIMSGSGNAARDYDLSSLKPGLYVLKGSGPLGAFADKLVQY